jgi:SAM-dependent methyltransferase
VAGKRLLHLQCHFGLDTLSWARLGALVTGVDLSDVSIDLARALACETGIQAHFVCADVQRLGGRFDGEFDVVVTSYGVLCWLRHLEAWAAGIAAALRPGGRFVIVEYHPILDVFYQGAMSGAGSYFGSAEGKVFETTGTYADKSAPISYTVHSWQHSVADVMNALLGAGLVIEQFHEYPFSSYRLFPELDTLRDGVWVPSYGVKWPYMFGISATRPRPKGAHRRVWVRGRRRS